MTPPAGPASPSDLELVARVLAQNDGAAFATLVRRHQGDVRRLLRRLTGGDAALADDLAQETFLRAYRGLSGYRGGARFGAWLHRIAYNAFLSAVRRTRTEPAADVAGDDDDAAVDDLPAPPGAAGADATLLRRQLEAALERLRPEERAAVALTFGRDMTHEDAAEVLGWPLGTLKTHVARARRKLARGLRLWKEPS